MSWMMIANRVEAKVYHLNRKGRMQLLGRFENPDGRGRNREFKHDQPGMSRARFAESAPYSLDGGKNPHDEVADQFARTLGRFLKKQVALGNFVAIKIVAEPRFLGKIKRECEAELGEKAEWIGKDLVNVPPAEWPRILGLGRWGREEEHVLL